MLSAVPGKDTLTNRSEFEAGTNIQTELLARWKGREPRFPLTPALSPKERENYRPRGDKARPPDISRDDRQSTLSLGRGSG